MARLNLSHAMEAQDVSHGKMARHLGKSRQIVSYYVSGECTPPLETAIEIADYLHVLPDKMKWLFHNYTDIVSDLDAKAQ